MKPDRSKKLRPEKTAILREMRGYLDGAEFLYLIDHTGMDVAKLTELRKQLRASGAQLHVVKRRLLMLLTEEKGWKELTAKLRGPVAAVSGKDDVAAAKTLRAFAAADTANLPKIKAGVAKNAYMSADDIDILAKLPPREVLLSRFVGTLAAPMSGLVGVLNQKLLSLLYALKAVEEKKAAASKA